MDWVVNTAPANTKLTPSSGSQFISAGPNGPLRYGQVEVRVTDNSAYLDNSPTTIDYSCSGIGGSPAVPCIIRLHFISSSYWGSSTDTIDLKYTPHRAAGAMNQFARADFSNIRVQHGFDHIGFELLSADTPGTTQINLDNVGYYANVYG